MAVTSKFIMSGIDLFDKKVYVRSDGNWTKNKSEAKVFRVGEQTSNIKKRSDITKIKIEWV